MTNTPFAFFVPPNTIQSTARGIVPGIIALASIIENEIEL